MAGPVGISSYYFSYFYNLHSLIPTHMKSILPLLFTLLLPGLTLAQWEQTNGPSPVLLAQSYAYSDNYVFVAASLNYYNSQDYQMYGGIYRSADKGVHWEVAGTGLPVAGSFFVFSVATQGQYVFAGTNSGVWRSADNGDTWMKVTNGHADTIVNLVATTSDRVFFMTSSHIYRSDDHGNTWIPSLNGTSGEFIFVSFVNNGSALFALDGYSGIYKSVNNGSSWSLISNISPGNLINVGSHLIANLGQNLGRSDDDGSTWTLVTGSLPIYIIVSKGSSIYAGGFGYFRRSDDLGSTWIPITNGIPLDYINSMGVDNSSVYVGTNTYGTYRTDNDGMRWYPANNGLPFDRVNVLATRWTNIFAGTNGEGVFHSDDLGNSWVFSNATAPSNNVSSLAIDGYEIYSGTDQGVFISNTFGEHWVAFNNGLTSKDVSAILKDSIGNLFAGTGSGGVFMSADDGANWNPANTGLANLDASCLVKSGSYLFCGTRGGGIFRSSNNGNNWSPVNNGLGNLYINSLVNCGNTLFAGTGNGAWISTDHGDTWSAVAAGLSNTYFNVLAVAGSQVFAGTNAGVYRYSVTGSEWVKVSERLPDTVVTALAASKTDLFAGLAGLGVWTRPLSDFSLLDVSPGSLTLSASSNISDTVFVVSSSDWVMHGTLPDWLWADSWSGTGNGFLVFKTLEDNPEPQARSAGFWLSSGSGGSVAFTVIQKSKPSGIEDRHTRGPFIYPVPSSGVIHIENSSPILEITVSNSEGKVIFSQKPGSSEEIIDLSGHGKGICFIRIITSDGVSVRKLIVE